MFYKNDQVSHVFTGVPVMNWMHLNKAFTSLCRCFQTRRQRFSPSMPWVLYSPSAPVCSETYRLWDSSPCCLVGPARNTCVLCSPSRVKFFYGSHDSPFSGCRVLLPKWPTFSSVAEKATIPLTDTVWRSEAIWIHGLSITSGLLQSQEILIARLRW